MNRRTLYSMVRVLFPLALSAGGCTRHGEAAAGPAPTPAGEAWLTPEQVKDKLILTEVVERDVGNVIPASGRVTFDDLRVSHVYSPVTGRITRIVAQPGQRLKKGMPLAVIQSPDVGSAFSDLAKAQADLTAAQHDFRRKNELYQAHAGSLSDFEAAEDNYGKAKAEMERAQQKARLLSRGSIDRVTQEFTLTSPIDGEVIARMANPGVEVQGQYSGGTAVELFTVGELDRVWVLADVFEMDLARVKKGQRVTVKAVAYPDKLFEGVVDWISSALDPTSRTAKVRCTIANPQVELKPEMYATVEIHVAGRHALAVPRSAVLRLGDQMVVFVQKGRAPDGRSIFERRAIAIDEDEDGHWIPVTHGLLPSEVVVSKGGIELLGMI
jgi:cobalt-zinc-cadmium efflux system membrane fusion protein